MVYLIEERGVAYFSLHSWVTKGRCLQRDAECQDSQVLSLIPRLLSSLSCGPERVCDIWAQAVLYGLPSGMCRDFQ